MATAPVRDLDDDGYERLEARTAGNNRSLEAELGEILVLASKQVDLETARSAAEAMRGRREGRPHRSPIDGTSRSRVVVRRPRIARRGEHPAGIADGTTGAAD